MLVLSTPSLPDGSAYRSSSLPSLHLQAKGSECSLTTRRRAAERTSPLERCCVGAHNSSSGPCVLNPSIEQNVELLTSHFFAAAKVLHRWLRRTKRQSSSPPVNNFGGTISTRALACRGRCPRRPLLGVANFSYRLAFTFCPALALLKFICTGRAIDPPSRP